MKHEKAIAALEAASRVHQKTEGMHAAQPRVVLFTASELLTWLEANG